MSWLFCDIDSPDVSIQTESSSGMIPRAVEQVFRVAEEMKSKGWEYKMEGQFLEIVGASRSRGFHN